MKLDAKSDYAKRVWELYDSIDEVVVQWETEFSEVPPYLVEARERLANFIRALVKDL